ncbi:MAG TPA: FtsX-like permease family protein, partial [Negativicutes bacterium]|nr:FtsX-like permease family protein [Negativicutes bacterium]
MRLAFKIALRFLYSGKSQTVLIALGIAVGVAVQVFIGSLIQGLQISLIDKTIGSSAHITITSESDDKTIKDWERTVYEAGISSSDIRHISPAADGSAFVRYDDGSEPVLLRGFKLAAADSIYGISDGLYAGRLPQRKDEIIMGRDLVTKIAVKLNDKINLVTNSGNTLKLKVTGFYDLKVASINKSWIIADLSTAQDIFGYDDRVTSIEMQVGDVFNADSIARRVRNSLSGGELVVENWKDQNGQLLSGLSGQSVSSYMIQVFVLIAVLLGISSVLAVSVVQRSKQLGILKAMGIKDGAASLIFVFQGLLLGIIGGMLGILLGIGLLNMFTKFAVNPDGSPVVPVYINPAFIALSGIFAIASAIVASLIPARLSSRLNPI